MKNKNKNYKYEQKRPMSTAKKWLVGIVTALLLVGCVGGITYGVIANMPQEETPPVEQTTPPVVEDTVTPEVPVEPQAPVVPDIEQDTRQIPINYKFVYDGKVIDSQNYDLLDFSNANSLDTVNQLFISKVPNIPHGDANRDGRIYEFYVNGNKCTPVPNGCEPSNDNIFYYKIKNLYIMFVAFSSNDYGITYTIVYTGNSEISSGQSFVEAESIDFVVTFEEPTTTV